MRPPILALLCATACFDPALPAGVFLCAAEEPRCPPGLTCEGEVCGRAATGVDAPPIVDAPLTVDGSADARAFDARPSFDARPPVDAPPSVDAPPPPDGGCVPGTFVQCQGANAALFCTTDGVEVRPCAFQCNAEARRCENCNPERDRQCVADTVITCSAAGEITSTLPCTGQSFCHAPEARCAILSPTNLPPAVCDSAAPDARTISADVAIDTDLCADGVKVPQSGGAPAICMLRYSTFAVEAGAILGATGKNALAIVATGRMDINGGITVGAVGARPGAGAIEAGAGGAGDDLYSDGGGGGGHGTDGASGATEDAQRTIPGGRRYGGDEISPLAGGSPGGRGGVEPSVCTVDCPVIARGGGGGGAVQLVGCKTLRFAALSAVAATGGGGEGGFAAIVNQTPLGRAGGGGGGGAGGAILIESPNLASPNVTFLSAAGGGGGGGGGLALGTRGGDGGDGAVSGPGPGGTPGAPPAGGGGAGGSRNSAGTSGAEPVGGETVQQPLHGAGAGGGAAGRIRIHTRADLPDDSFVGSFIPFPTFGVVKVH
jgi:hypothetical protein